MYLTGGQYKGHKIEVPNSAKPTLSKVRESIFNILLQFDTGGKFLDMFAGSAIMGLEAISRGYEVLELEINPKNAQVIKKNYAKIKLKANLVVCNAMKFQGDVFDIIYIDPPWEYDYLPIIKKAVELSRAGGILIVEHDSKLNLDLVNLINDNNLALEIVKSKKYGRCLIDFLRLK